MRSGTFDISLEKDAGEEWQPYEGEQVTVSVPASILNLTDGEKFLVHHTHDDYIGYIAIPNYELELPIMADWSMEKLQIAPCLQYGSPLTDDAVIAGHNYKQHFRALHEIEVGEYLTFTDMTGYTIAYNVVDVKTIDPRSVYEVINSEYDLTLYTCTTGGASRVIVSCNRVSHLPESKEQT